jgi:transcription termination factor NusG
MGELEIRECPGEELSWFVAHTRPRCEKKLLQYCNREDIRATLPCVRSKKRYGHKTVEFEKPLFPGYLFFCDSPERALSVLRSDYTANVLTVFDQAQFAQQVRDVLFALESGCMILGALGVAIGREVRITTGPLAGMAGKVVQVAGQDAVVIRLDFIGQGAAVAVNSGDVEFLD